MATKLEKGSGVGKRQLVAGARVTKRKKKQPLFHCTICDMSMWTQEYFDAHLEGRKHVELAELKDIAQPDNSDIVFGSEEWKRAEKILSKAADLSGVPFDETSYQTLRHYVHSMMVDISHQFVDDDTFDKAATLHAVKFAKNRCSAGKGDVELDCQSEGGAAFDHRSEGDTVLDRRNEENVSPLMQSQQLNPMDDLFEANETSHVSLRRT